MEVWSVNGCLASANRELRMNEELSFEAVVLDAFAPIMSKHGYSLVESDDSYVRLDSRNCSIQMHYDRHRSFEVGVGFSELVNGECQRRTPFNLGEVFREFGVPDADAISFSQSSDITSVRNYLVSVVERLMTYCEPILIGDCGAFKQVNHRRSVESAAYTRQIQLQSVRGQADRAWIDKDYQEFANLLSKFRDMLPESDQRKLEYAEKKLIGG